MDVYKRASDLTVVEHVKIQLHDARFVHFGFAALLAVSIGIIFIVGYQFGNLGSVNSAVNAEETSNILAARAADLSAPTVTPIPKVSSSNADIDIVSYSRNFSLPLLKTNGVIYIDENSPFNYIPDPTKLQWSVIATPSGDVLRDAFRKIYSFKRFAVAKDGTDYGFAFVMRWDFSHYDVFLYHTDAPQGSMAQRIGSFFSPSRDPGHQCSEDRPGERGWKLCRSRHASLFRLRRLGRAWKHITDRCSNRCQETHWKNYLL